MGYNNAGALKFLVDIETAPIANAADYLELADITAPANYKDADKIAAYCREKQQELIAKAALDLDLCRIVAIGWLREDEDAVDVRVSATETQERQDLRAFWDDLDDRVTIGYNQVAFDLPILLRRSLYLGIATPTLNLDKYRSNHVDLQQRLSLNGTKPYRSLNWYCKRFGLDVPCDETSGKDIGALVAAENWAAVAAHCRTDVLKTKALAQRLGLLVPQPRLQQLTEAGF